MPFKKPHPLYHVWRSMRDRCLNPNFRQWNDYGGRGIKICKRWDDFHVFVADMGPRPDGYSLDRIDNDGDYSPANCRWASKKTQQRNQRRAVFVDIDGKRYRAIDLAEKAGVKTDTIVERAKRGLSFAEVTSSEPLRDLSGLAVGGLVSGYRKLQRTHCPHGHAFDGANTSHTKNGHRVCKACKREKAARDRAAKRAAQS